MMNDDVLPNKYEIPGSLGGLDWREKCIISPWMYCSEGVIDIITLRETDILTESVGETVRDGGNKGEKERSQKRLIQ